MTKVAGAEATETLELVEHEKHSEEKLKTISKDILRLKSESDLVVLNHLPKLSKEVELLSSNLIVLREDHADTNRLVRKMYYDMFPAVNNKLIALSAKVDTLSGKIDNLCLLMEEFLKK